MSKENRLGEVGWSWRDLEVPGAQSAEKAAGGPTREKGVKWEAGGSSVFALKG